MWTRSSRQDWSWLESTIADKIRTARCRAGGVEAHHFPSMGLIMRRLAVAGIDSAVGSAVMVHFDGTAEVSGVRLEEESAVAELCRTCTDIIVCGDASRSSWGDDSEDLTRDMKLLPRYVQLAADADVRLVYISSDAVFGGPWVFHDDDSDGFSDSSYSRQLRQIEQCVLTIPRNLVVRTNALSDVSDSWLDHLRQSFRQQTPQRVSANRFATPLASSRLALLLDHILLTSAAGVVHLAGAERMSAWNFASELARMESASVHCALPSIENPPCEQSLRCTRARQEFLLRMPTLNQTIEELVGGSASGRLRAA